MNNLALMMNFPGVQGRLNWMPGSNFRYVVQFK